LPAELCANIEHYRNQVGPGSYDTPHFINGSLFKKSPAYSICGRNSIIGAFIPMQYNKDQFGSQSPGVGSYSPEASVIRTIEPAPKMGCGLKCPSSNFELPSISPGPIYSSLHPTNLAQKAKTKSVVN